MRKKILDELRKVLREVIREVDVNRFNQEPTYVCALLSKLDGKKLFVNPEQVIIRSTIVSDRGANSAESKYGADFAVILEIYNDDGTIFKKAILGQAKKGAISSRSGDLPATLKKQVEKMSKYTDHILIMETPDDILLAPRVRMQNPKNPKLEKEIYALEDYLLDYFIACTHGDLREDFVLSVCDSKLSNLKIMIGSAKVL